MVKGKSGISAIVATVLVILLTIVAIMIVWTTVVPMVQEIDEGLSEEDSKVFIVIEKGYTIYDPAQHFAFVQVKRGADEENLSKLRIIFTIDGNSVPFETAYAPSSNGEATYSFDFIAHNVEGQPEMVSVAPVFDVNGKDKIGKITSSVEMPIKPASVSESAKEKAEDNTYVGDDTRIHLTGCGILNVENGEYVLDNNIVNDSTCFIISANGIILDGNGFEISGDGDLEDYGVYVNGYNEIVIRNFGGIEDFGSGMYFYSSLNNVLENNVLIDSVSRQNTQGIYFILSSGNITDNRLGKYYRGIFFMFSSSSFITNTQISNTLYGIYIFGGSDNLIEECTLESNYGGVYLLGGASQSNITNNKINSNDMMGISIVRSSNNLISDNEIKDNRYGIYLQSSSSNEFKNNTICSDSEDFSCLNDLGNIDSGNIFNESKVDWQCGDWIRGSTPIDSCP